MGGMSARNAASALAKSLTADLLRTVDRFRDAILLPVAPAVVLGRVHPRWPHPELVDRRVDRDSAQARVGGPVPRGAVVGPGGLDEPGFDEGDEDLGHVDADDPLDAGAWLGGHRISPRKWPTWRA